MRKITTVAATQPCNDSNSKRQSLHSLKRLLRIASVQAMVRVHQRQTEAAFLLYCGLYFRTPVLANYRLQNHVLMT